MAPLIKEPAYFCLLILKLWKRQKIKLKYLYILGDSISTSSKSFEFIEVVTLGSGQEVRVAKMLLGHYNGKTLSFSLSVQGKAQFSPTMCFFPESPLLSHTEHFTSNTSGHQICGGFLHNNQVSVTPAGCPYHLTHF